MTETVRFEKKGAVAELILDRPRTYNAFDLDMIGDLAEQIVRLAGDDSVRAMVITGSGKAFCAGGDLKAVLDWPGGAPAGFHELAARFHTAIGGIRRARKPVIAAINGIAAGGGFSLALACDFRVMSEKAVLRQAFTASALTIDGSGTWALPRLVGLARAMEIMAFDEPIDAERALSWGLVTQVVAEDEVMPRAREMAMGLARKSVNAFGACKRLLSDALDTPLEAHMEREREALAAAAGHPDGREGLEAFQAKRKPVYYKD